MAKPDIETFFHCKQCLAVLPPGVSPKDHARLSVGFTPKGIQVWCVRHEVNIINLDFLGQKVGQVHDPMIGRKSE